MEIEYFGASALKIKSGGVSVGFDLGQKGGALKDLRAVFVSDNSKQTSSLGEDTLKLDMPGEYEIGPFSVRSVAEDAYGDVYGTTKSNVYLVDAKDFGSVGIIAYASKELSEEAGELLANARILVIPVGGMGLGLEPEEALKIVKDLNVEYVIPVHFEDGKTKYESPQAPVEEFVKLTGTEPQVIEGKLNTKSLEAPTEGFRVVVVKP